MDEADAYADDNGHDENEIGLVVFFLIGLVAGYFIGFAMGASA